MGSAITAVFVEFRRMVVFSQTHSWSLGMQIFEEILQQTQMYATVFKPSRNKLSQKLSCELEAGKTV